MPIVLQIEDNALNRRLVERVAARWDGVTLVSATTGRQGLYLAAELRPDLVLLDIGLPDVGGAEVLDTLRRRAESANTPIVVITANTGQAIAQRLQSRGATALLSKPLDLRAFDELVGGLLGL